MSTLDDNLKKRMAETMGSESDPEMYTPNAAGPDESPDEAETFPLTRQFRDTNFGPRGTGYSRNTGRRGGRGSGNRKDD